MKQFKVLSDEEIQAIWDMNEGWISWVQYGKTIAKAQLKKVLEMPDGVENPYPEWESLACLYHPLKWLIFHRAIQTIKQALEESTNE